MSILTSSEVDQLISEAESSSSCLMPQTGPVAQRLRRRARQGELVSPQRGIFVRTARWKTLNPCERDVWSMRALSPAHPGWVFCNISAAEIHQLWVPWRLGGTLYATHLSDPRGGRRPTSKIRWRREPAAHSEIVDGVRVTPLNETIVDCLRECSFTDALGIADSWIRQTGYTREDLLKLVEQYGAHCRGVEQARCTALYADGKSENGGESFARARMIELGYAVPQLQVEIPDPLDPWNVNRVDYLWAKADGSIVIGELDGMIKYTDPAYMGGLNAEQVRARERQRESRLAVPGASVMRFSLDDVKNSLRFCRLLDRYGVPKRIASV